MKHKISIVVILVLLAQFMFFIRLGYSATYVLTPTVPSSCPAKMFSIMKATIVPATSLVKVELLAEWSGQLYTNTTTNGVCTFNVSIPSLATASPKVKFQSPSTLNEFTAVEVPITIINGVKVDLRYLSQQYYAPVGDPQPEWDILINVTARATETGTPITATYAITGTPTLLKVASYTPSQYLDILRIAITDGVTGTYRITVMPTASGYASVASVAVITVGGLKVVLECVFSTGEVGYSGPGGVSVSKDAKWMEFYLKNTKNLTLVFEATPKVYYTGEAGGNEEEVTYVTPISSGGKIIGYKIVFDFYENRYTFRIVGDSAGYSNINEPLKINTGTYGSILDFLKQPIAWIVIIGGAILVFFIFGRRKKSSTYRPSPATSKW